MSVGGIVLMPDDNADAVLDSQKHPLPAPAAALQAPQDKELRAIVQGSVDSFFNII
jgi:hypothetical protein